jgi:hypothetical protein
MMKKGAQNKATAAGKVKAMESATPSSIVALVAAWREKLGDPPPASLAVPVDSFDAMLEHDPDFARRVLDLESRRLQRLTRETTSVSRA